MDADRSEPPSTRRDSHPPSGFLFLTLASLGIVFGDIGTSPLYALRECFHGPHAISVTPANVMGVLSLIFWALMLVVSLKYLAYVLRADNNGEGGILSLMSLLRVSPKSGEIHTAVALLGLFGAALLYGDGMITPAISVLSAMEGLEIITPAFSQYVVPMTVVVLLLLFSLQSYGTGKVGSLFGPLMLVWFSTLAILGVHGIAMYPGVMAAVSPAYAVRYFLAHGLAGFWILGAVFLVVTGSEAIYADLGHFGKGPIRASWFFVAFPALLLNYFGQGALILKYPAWSSNPFYYLAPQWALSPLVLLATAATVVASQAVITGAFSLTRQAVQLGYLPRMQIIHTSAETIGQIYMPEVNMMLCAATITLVLAFKRSTHLAAAYGIAVSTTMIITSLLAYGVARKRWHWSRLNALALTGVWVMVDIGFMGANWVKFLEGGWVPVCSAMVVVLIFITWNLGQRYMLAMQERDGLPIQHIIEEAANGRMTRIPGDAVFFTAIPGRTPNALLHNLKHNKVLHARNIFVTIKTKDIPHVREADRIEVSQLSPNFYQFIIHYGFMDVTDLPKAFALAAGQGLRINAAAATFILSRNSILLKRSGVLKLYRNKLFRFLYRNAVQPALFFRLPANRVIEIGRQIQL